MTFRYPAFILSFLVGVSAFAQDRAIQTSNASYIKWSQIRTPGFQIIFPQGYEQQAQRVASTLEFIREPESKSLGVVPKSIPVVLQNQTSVSNGFVTLGPRRSEFFTMPPQDYNTLGTNDWLSLLASHEYRHIVQYQRSITGFNKFVYYAFGQNGVSLVSYAAAPPWFWEGDAVAAETAFTNSGRGRIPNFSLLFRTNFQEGRVFNYHKQFLRSYKHNIPDHYVLGYHMISYLRNKTGDPDVWERIVGRSWAAPYIPFGFSRAIRKETGLTVNGLYREMAGALEADWKKKTEETTMSEFKPVSVRTSKSYIDYLYPQPQEDGSVIALKTGIGEISQIIVLKDGIQSKRLYTGPMNSSGMLSAAADKVVWNEFRFDPRWRAHSYTVVRELDLARFKVRDVTSKTRYSAAALSPDGKFVATVESNEKYEARLLILEEGKGSIVKIFPVPGNKMITMPRWANNGDGIVALLTGEGKRSVGMFRVEDGSFQELIAPSEENVGHPVLHGKYLFYNSPLSGVDNIYALDTSTGKRYQVTSSKYGSYNPAISPDGDWIFYNEQARNGMDIVKVAFEPSFWTQIEILSAPTTNLYDKLVEQEGHPDLLNNVPSNKKFPVSKYSQLGHMFNVHSWGPYFNSDVTTAIIGVYSKNVLSTTMVDVGYEFDLYERTGVYKGAISYQGLYPVIDAEILYGKRVVNNTVDQYDIQLTWTETGAVGGVRLPFVLTRGKNITNLTFKDAVGLTHVEDFSTRVVKDNLILRTGTDRRVQIDANSVVPYTSYPGNGNLIYNQTLISFSRYWRTSRRDINPKWGQLADLEFYSTPFGGDYKGYLSAFRGVLYFPGAAKHHSMFARLGYQVSSPSIGEHNYTFRNSIFRPRGFTYARDYKFVTLSGNYTMPVWYPDFSLGPLVNFQRIRTNVFYDFGQSTSRNFSAAGGNVTKDYQSAGVEVTFDINIMRLLPQFDIGFRYTKGISGKEDMTFEVLVGSLNF